MIGVIGSNSNSVVLGLSTIALNVPACDGTTIVNGVSDDNTPATPAPASENLTLKVYEPTLLEDRLDTVAVSFTELYAYATPLLSFTDIWLYVDTNDIQDGTAAPTTPFTSVIVYLNPIGGTILGYVPLAVPATADPPYADATSKVTV